jgi:hypothetical protein
MLDSKTDFFDTAAKVLLRCWLLGFVLMLLMFGMYMLAGDLVHRLHGDMFGLSTHELDVVFYCGMGLVKLCVLTFFLIPWAAVRLVLRKAKA